MAAEGAQDSYGGAGTRNSRTSCCAYLGDASSLVFMLQHIFSKSIRLQFEVRNGLLEFCRRIRQVIDVGLDDLDYRYGSLPLLE